MIQDVKLKQQALFFKMLLHNINSESAFGEYYTSNNDLMINFIISIRCCQKNN